MNKKKIGMIIAIPLILGTLYSGLKFGYISPMVKGLDVHILGGTFITNINKYVIKVGDKVGLSAGDYIVVPTFSKEPTLKFVVLDDSGVLSVEGDTLIANKEGISSIGILNKNRVLKKTTIMVVNPTINNMETAVNNRLKYYGDEAKIASTVNIDDYKKLEKGYKLNYSTTDPNILKISGDTVEAVGVGEAKLISRYDRKEVQTSFNILPRVDALNIDKIYSLEEGQSMQLHPQISTSPEGSKSDIKYKILGNDNYKKFDENKYDENKLVHFGDSGLEDNLGITVDKDGNIKANRVGTYLVEVSSGEKSEKTSVEVKPRSFKNIEIENLQYIFEKKKDEIDLELGWDYNERVDNYRIYVKDASDEDFSLFTTIKTNENFVSNGKRVSELLKLDLDKENSNSYDFQVYVVGYNGTEETKKSNTIRINNKSTNDFQKNHVNNIKYRTDRENSTISFRWSPIDNKKYTYRIYYKNMELKEPGYKLVAKNIEKNSTTIKVDDNVINYNFYVVAVNEEGQISGFSKPVRIKENFSE
ncbi:MAG: hypothetical protein RR561_03600 [Peptostreptococcus sp.]|uniref:hypothetical protein n=1 Tax=Peptostreptococcus sp. TaxID=1262 RepID=UPI002FCB27C4